MQRRNGIKTLSVVALLIAAIGLTVAFAAMSQTLTIKGTATMDSAKWDIHFEKFSTHTEGAAKFITQPTLQENGTYIGDFEVSLSKPGDYAAFYFDIVNSGDIDAKGTDFLINNLSLKNSENAYLSAYVEADWDGDGQTTEEEKIKTSENINYDISDMEIAEDYIIKAGEKYESYFFVIGFNEYATELPKGEVTLKLNIEMLFEQA